MMFDDIYYLLFISWSFQGVYSAVSQSMTGVVSPTCIMRQLQYSSQIYM